jgi:hypothetical protein
MTRHCSALSTEPLPTSLFLMCSSCKYWKFRLRLAVSRGCCYMTVSTEPLIATGQQCSIVVNAISDKVKWYLNSTPFVFPAVILHT